MIDLSFLKLGERISLAMGAQVKAVPGSDRIITFIASTDGLDRHGTKVMPMGINTDRYNGNPIILFGHDGYGGFFSTPDPKNIIGKSVALRKSDKKLEVDVQFLEAEVNPNADMIYRMVKAGALNAVSIGFIPREVRTELDESEHEVPVITKSELLEISVVPIPSNPEALALHRELTKAMGAVSISLKDISAKEIRDTIIPELTSALSDTLASDPEMKKRWLEILSVPAGTRQIEKPALIERGAMAYGDLPLSERGHAWDGSAARSRMAKAASSDGSGDKDKIDWNEYARGFFWFDGDSAETLGAYKLPFADVVDGKRTAIWGGVTAAAQRLDGTDIPDADKETVRTTISQYYSKAAEQFEDDSIVPPWNEEKATPPAAAAELGVGSITKETLQRGMEEVRLRLAIRLGLGNNNTK